MKKKCSGCGKVKNISEFYTRKREMDIYGPNDLRSYRHLCKKCNGKACKERNKKAEHKHNGGKFYFVYFIYDKNNKLIYIGKTKDVIERLREHEKEKRFYRKDISKVQFELVETDCDACVREIYYINKYKPKLNIRDVFKGKMKSTTINRLKRYTIVYHTYKQFGKDVEAIVSKYLKK